MAASRLPYFTFKNGAYDLKEHVFTSTVDPSMRLTRGSRDYHPIGKIVATIVGVPCDALMVYVWDKLQEVHSDYDGDKGFSPDCLCR